MNKELDENQIWDIENAFYWFAPVERFSKYLTHYELYKRIVAIPGDIAEFGVYKGCSLISFCIFRSLLEDATARRIWGFDAFGRFPRGKNLAFSKVR